MRTGTFYAIVRANYVSRDLSYKISVQFLTYSETTGQADEWTEDPQKIQLFDCEQKPEELAEKLSLPEWPCSVVTLHFTDTTED